MSLIHRLVKPVVAVPALAAIFLLGAAPAGAITGSVQFTGPATLVAHGVAIDVPATASATCDAGYDFAILDIVVTQSRGTIGAYGESQSAAFPCDGQPHNLTTRLPGGIFHGGIALASAFILQCGGDPEFGLSCAYTDVHANQEIKIRG